MKNSNADKSQIIIEMINDVSERLKKRHEDFEKIREREAEFIFNEIVAYGNKENSNIKEFEYEKLESGLLRIKDQIGDNLDLKLIKYFKRENISYFINHVLKNSESSRQSAAALKRHAENHAMKQDVFNWLEKNRSTYRSKDATATAIANNVVPITWRTARAWIDQWEKKQSAGTL